VMVIVPSAHSPAATSPSDAAGNAWLLPTRTAWLWLPGNAMDSTSRCTFSDLMRIVAHGVAAVRNAGSTDSWQLPVSSASELTAIFTLAVAEPPPGAASWNLEAVTQVRALAFIGATAI
jgi:hypothetical protein